MVALPAMAQQLNSGVGTATIFTSNTEPASREQTFTGTARWAVSTGPAVEISNTGQAVINVQTGAIVSSSAATGTIVTRGFNALTGVTINNSGSIINSNGSNAISATATTAAGANVPVTINNTGSIIGGIFTGNGNDLVSNTNGVIIGTVDLNDGTNTISINGGALTGNVNTGNNNDTFSITNGGLVTGAVNLGNGNNIATINSGTLNGSILMGTSGGNTLTLTNGTVSGSINLGSGNGDVFNISGSQPFTTFGSVAGADTVNISASTVNIRHTFSDIAELNIETGSRVNVSQSLTMSNTGVLTNRGTLNLGAGTVLTAPTVNFANGGRLIVGVTSSTSFGQLGVSGGGMTAASYTINLSGAGYIASGTTMTIVDANGASTLAANSLTNSGQQGVHSFLLGLVNGGTDVQLTIQRVSTSSLVGDVGGKNAADRLEVLGNDVTGELQAVQSAITNATTAGQVAALAESLTPGIDGLGAATLGVTQAASVQISNRLASLRTGDAGQGVATGMGLTSNNVWLEGFGNQQTQDDRSSGPGYEATGYGATFGLDSDDLLEGANIGVAFSYGKSSVDGKGGNRSEADVTNYLASLYGSTIYESGIFINSQLTGGWNEYDLTRTIGAGVGKATASTNGWQASAKGEVGVDLPVGNLTITPVVGVQATYLHVDGYTEKGGGNAGLTVKTEAMTTVDGSAGVRAAYTVALADGSTIRPMIRASVVNRSGDKALNTTSQLRGGGAAFKTPGAEADSSAFVLGAGLLIATAGGTDFTADYDAEVRSSSINHVFKLKSRIPF